MFWVIFYTKYTAEVYFDLFRNRNIMVLQDLSDLQTPLLTNKTDQLVA